MSAWTGILLRVDLAAKTVKKEPLNMKNAHEYVGRADWAPSTSATR